MSWNGSWFGSWFGQWFGGASSDPSAVTATGIAGATGSCDLFITHGRQAWIPPMAARVQIRRRQPIGVAGSAGATGNAAAGIRQSAAVAAGMGGSWAQARVGRAMGTVSAGHTGARAQAQARRRTTIAMRAHASASAVASGSVRSDPDADLIAMIIALDQQRNAA